MEILAKPSKNPDPSETLKDFITAYNAPYVIKRVRIGRRKRTSHLLSPDHINENAAVANTPKRRIIGGPTKTNHLIKSSAILGERDC